ncbi:T9SS type A sorting domain-containing protein [Hymenobacter negativus]|uniref:T9SS type A sorting domain-containing protein n=1 Tax=Hymenobacter negativus TaxID=2795026 RepID=A0ABS3QCF3_9BACT|nr:T9SS type A sorting domain-containing protein [Hymenobacter negativus]MBO2008910.1 T9SS type A sorting domain-containing protein [Hymenobacter negativus]
MKQLSPLEQPVTTSSVAWLRALLLVLLLGQFHSARAQFPRVESFKNASAASFTLGGSAVLTAANSLDPAGAGYLRLTPATTDQSGFVIDQGQFPAPNGFNISFEFFSYGGTGADGFSVFLVDADQTSAASFAPGASGGSLGYAQKTANPFSNGVPFGYLGIGIDEFGNFSNGTEGRVGGINTPDLTPNAVALRGAGNGSSSTDYPYLTGTPTLPFSLDVPTARAQAGSADYRRAYIDVVPTNGTYRITVRIQHGFTVETAVRNFTVPRPPNNLRIGFAGSTGGSTNVHEIRNLAIRQTPYLDDDVASTIYNQAVSVNVLNNDSFSYANYGPGSVDLDPDATGIQSTLTVPGQGTFVVTPAGVVTFTPSGTFAGVVTIPYTANDVLGETGAPANITVIVRGADIANSVSGPTAAAPGAQVQYTMTTANLGSLPATNVVPTLQLPTGLSGVVVSSGSYSSSTGRVTFGASSLAAGGAPATNTVTFIVPASGSVVATTANTAAEPDPVSTNNLASITTLISGLANLADVCATPGNDGVGSLGAASAPNTYFPGLLATTTGGTSSITVGPALTGTGASTTPIAAGDLVLVMQMQGATINTSNTASYGSGGSLGKGNLTGSGDRFTAGLYEYAVAASSVGTTGGTLTLTQALTNAYDNLDYNASSNPTGQRRFQVIRVPQYSALAVADSVAGAAWNGKTGGVLALDVAGRTTFATNARLSMTGRGFRGGGGKLYSGVGALPSFNSTDFSQLSSSTAVGSGGAKGEGTAGTPAYLNGNYTALISTGFEGYRNGSNGRGAPGNAGGGGTDLSPSNNLRNTGGGGGANGGEGGFGGYGLSYTGNVTDNAQGIGGAAFGASVGRLSMGGGGGAGVANDGGLASGGNTGGGIIMLRTGAIAGNGAVVANGLAAATTLIDGAGGGGAGGSVLLLVSNASTLSNITATARGGRGGRASLAGALYGPGGGGGGGVVVANGTVASASSVASGANGATGSTLSAFGATAGTIGVIQTNAATSGSGNTACLPVLTVAVSTATPTIIRSGPTGPVPPALYTINVSNTGGTATGVSILGSLRNNLFKFDGTYTPIVTLTLADGTTSTPSGFSLPTNGVSQPVFAGFTIPAGAMLALTFRATIDATAQNGLAYRASATTSYDNPLRTSLTTASVQPGENYAGGTDTSLGTAIGSNYAGGAGTPENVTIQAPLPVSLVRFTAVAAHFDAQLQWLTANEHNNDRFVVERSFDGKAFATIGTVRGNWESTTPSNYEFVDVNVARFVSAGKPVYYRLRQVDRDSTSTYSPLRTVVFGAKSAATLYPNPAGRSATLDLSSLPAGNYTVQVLDLTGRQVATYSLAGTAQHLLELQHLATGAYVVRVHGGAVNQSLLLTRE